MQLAGQVKDVTVPEIFRLLKMGRKSGTLRVSNGKSWGEVLFQNGEIYYASSSGNGPSLGERLVRAGKLTPRDLSAVLAAQKRAERPPLLGTLLKEQGLVPEEALRQYLREQIEDSVFHLFSWPEADFEFFVGEEPAWEDVAVSLDPEGVVMEGCRRVDEWRVILEHIGSLEKVPHLVPLRLGRQIKLQPHEWQVICFIDGRRDMNTIVADSGFDRFRTAKTIHGLLTAGLVVTRDPTLELLGQRLALAVRGPIDIYNLTFLTSLCTSEISNHLRIESIDDEEVEVHIAAGVREDEDGGALLYFCEAHTPPSVIRRMAFETSGFIVLVNINSRDSVHVARADVALMEEIGDKPWVVATYASLVDEKVNEQQVRDLLQLPSRVPVVNCNLRDPEETSTVVGALMRLMP